MTNRRLRRLFGLVGLLLVGLLLLVALWPEQVAPYSPFYRFGTHFDAKGDLQSPPFAPGGDHLLGTDVLGRDLFSMLVWGTRYSLLLGLFIVAARFVLALPVAFLTFYGGRRLYGLLQRLYLLTTAVPPLLIYIVFLSTPELLNFGDRRALLLNLTLLTLLEWPRLSLSLVGWLDRLSHQPFVEGAVAVGLSRWQILRRHLVPHLVIPTTTLAAAEMGRVLMLAGQLGLFQVFLGGGLIIFGAGNPPEVMLVNRIPEWGAILAEARHHLFFARWNLVYPALTLFIAIFAFHLVSEGLADLYDSWGGRLRSWVDRVPRWRRRLGWVFSLLFAGFLYFQGLPWGDEARIVALLEGQAIALAQGDQQEFARAMAPRSPAVTKRERTNWFAQIAGAEPVTVSVSLSELELSTRRAVATYAYVLGLPDGRQVRVEQEQLLVKRWGRWQIWGEPYDQHQTRWGYLITAYPMDDPVVSRQGVINYLATVIDREGHRLAADLPGFFKAGPLVVKIYPSQAHLVGAVAPLSQPGNLRHYYLFGESLRADLEFLSARLNNSFDLQSIITEALIGQGVSGLTGRRPAPLLYTGLQTLYGKLNREMVILPAVLEEAGSLRSLAELTTVFDVDAGYRLQTGLLVQWLFEEHSGSAIVSALQTIGAGSSELAAIAQATGLTEAQVVAQYDSYVHKRVGSP